MAAGSVYAQLNEADQELLEVVADEELDVRGVCRFAFGLILVDGANINVQREGDGFTALHVAAERGFDWLVLGLLRAGADITLEDENGQTALQLAEEVGQADIVAIFEDVANPDEQRRYDVFTQVDSELFNVIADAEGTHYDICDDAFAAILLDDAHVNAIDPQTGNTPLHAAAERGNLLLARGLVRLGANVNTRNTLGLSPMDLAVRDGHVEMAVVLADELGADLTGEDFNRMTPLHVAAQFGRAEMVAPLMLAGAELEAQDYLGRTPLYYAVREGHQDMVQALMNAGAGAYVVDDLVGGGTPLHVAVQQGDLNVATYFMNLGTDMTTRDSEGMTAYRQARLAGRAEFMELFWGRAYLAEQDGDFQEEAAPNQEAPRFSEATRVRRVGPRYVTGIADLNCMQQVADRKESRG